jgi:hypothetical protein
MPKPLEIPFCGPAYEEESYFAAGQECINFYLRPYQNAMGENKFALFGTPGLEAWVTPGPADPVRCLFPWGNYLYSVIGSAIYRTDKQGVSVQLQPGAFVSGSGQVSCATNGTDIVMVDGATGWVITISSGSVSEITDSDFPVADKVVHIDGYYLVNRAGTGQVYRSADTNGSSWSGLAFSTAGRNPDNAVGLLVDHNDVIVFGEISTEFWFNTGEETFNFDNIGGAYIEQGLENAHLACKVNNGVYFMGKDERGDSQLFQMTGRNAVVVSHPFMSNKFRGYTRSDAFMFGFQQNGHAFVVITFPTDNITWVYDTTTGFWHRRSSKIQGREIRWRANAYAFFDGNHIIGDYANGKLYKMKTDVYEDNGADMVSTRITGILRQGVSRVTINELTVINEPGVGLNTGNAEDIDPQAMLSWSYDGGKTWSNQHEMSLGKIGEVDNTSVHHCLGQGVNWVFKYAISAAVKRVILGAFAEYENDD